jgi:hypothetical protein
MGINPNKIKDIKNNISNLQVKPQSPRFINQIKVLENALDKVLEMDEGRWNQGAKVSWLKNWDKNTRFFFTKKPLKGKLEITSVGFKMIMVT